MFDLDSYLNDLISSCRAAFGERLLYVGFQGSYLRGEARENSDIDVMVILDQFSVEDMDRYREILKKIGSYERSCGFICGKDELLRWNPLEVCQLRHTTKDLFGVLTDYLPPATREDEVNCTIWRAVALSSQKRNSRRLFQRKTGGCWSRPRCRTDLISIRRFPPCLPGVREPLRVWIALEG